MIRESDAIGPRRRWPAAALLTAVTCCAPTACAPADDDAAAPTRTPSITTATTQPSPPSPAPSPTATASTATPSVTAPSPPSSGMLRLTVEDEGRTITMGIGDEAVLILGGGLDWADPQLDDDNVSLSEQVSDEPAQGRTWEVVARTRGTTELTVAGSPTCRSTTPPCLAPDRLFTIRFEVLAPDP